MKVDGADLLTSLHPVKVERERLDETRANREDGIVPNPTTNYDMVRRKGEEGEEFIDRRGSGHRSL